jgi:hypothetical protein
MSSPARAPGRQRLPRKPQQLGLRADHPVRPGAPKLLPQEPGARLQRPEQPAADTTPVWTDHDRRQPGRHPVHRSVLRRPPGAVPSRVQLSAADRRRPPSPTGRPAHHGQPVRAGVAPGWWCPDNSSHSAPASSGALPVGAVGLLARRTEAADPSRRAGRTRPHHPVMSLSPDGTRFLEEHHPAARITVTASRVCLFNRSARWAGVESSTSCASCMFGPSQSVRRHPDQTA